MNTILMAAARGARIELFGRDLKWHEANAAPLKRHTFPYRIHPDDEHLRFGPISSALREMAKTPKQKMFVGLTKLPHTGFMVEHETWEEVHELAGYSEIEHSLFLLILSEALAEEGL